MRRLWLAALVSLCASVCRAEVEAELITVTDDNIAFFVIPDRIKRSGLLATGWIRSEPERRRPVIRAQPKGAMYTHIMSLQRANCSDETLQVVSSTYYDGIEPSTSTGSVATVPQPVIPGSVGDMILKRLCR